MRELACKGKIDGAIVRDLDAFFEPTRLPS